MKPLHVLPLLATLALLSAAQLRAAEPPKPPAMPVRADGIKLSSIPDHAPLPPEDKGKPYKVPATQWELRPIIWGWSCELPDGSGLQFGGVNQISDDGRGRTCVKDGANWKPLIDELRKNNVLQKHFEGVWALRNGTKDALARARSLYFDGKTADEESKTIKATVDPALSDVVANLTKKIDELKSLSGLEAYESGQVKAALKHLEAAAGLIKPIGETATPELLTTLRRGQIELELASEPLDAEPPPRALSVIAYDAKTKLLVIFGGDHTDYFTNDLWVFDPAKRKWTEHWPEQSPEPRADHHLDFAGDGRVVLSGGYNRGAQGYAHLGAAKWVYDVEKNVWSADGHAEKLVATAIRTGGYEPPAAPEAFMKGPRPDAAANEAKLKAVAPNAWVKLEPLVPLGGRDWGHWAFDPDRDMYYVYAGGHASYPGNDVARYHFASGRWEITDPIEFPLGGSGSNEQYPCGVNFNLRPWCRPHVWNSQTYDPASKKMINAAVCLPKIDPYFYVYDPDKSDWTERHRVADPEGFGGHGLQLRATTHGLFGWYGDAAWMLDTKAMQWKRIDVKGKMPNTVVDGCGMSYDAKRDRMLLMTLGGYAKPYDGQIYALDLKTMQVAPLNPEGMMDAAKNWRIYLREAEFDPTSDLMLCAQMLNCAGKALPDHLLGYDPAKNRWILIKTPGVNGQPFADNCVCASLAYDAKRKLFWCGDSSWNGFLYVLRFDAATAEITALKDAALPAPAPAPAPAAKK